MGLIDIANDIRVTINSLTSRKLELERKIQEYQGMNNSINGVIGCLQSATGDVARASGMVKSNFRDSKRASNSISELSGKQAEIGSIIGILRTALAASNKKIQELRSKRETVIEQIGSYQQRLEQTLNAIAVENTNKGQYL